MASVARRKKHEDPYRPKDQVACKGTCRASWTVAQGARARERTKGSEPSTSAAAEI